MNGEVVATSARGNRNCSARTATHDAFCAGCCWMIMALLFVPGVMNLAWVAVLSGIVLLEKIFPAGPAIPRGAGVLFVVAGVALIA